MRLAPIVLFVYNRPEHTRQTVEALQKNFLADKSELFIYSDAAKDAASTQNVELVRKYVMQVGGFKNVVLTFRDRNWGLAESIIDGVTVLVSKHGRIIVLEDDLVTSPYFLKYLNEALETYASDARIMSISGYNHPRKLMRFPKTYRDDFWLSLRNSSWGWGTWADRWEKVDWHVKDYASFSRNTIQRNQFNLGGDDLCAMLDSQMRGKINSWAIRFSYAHFSSGSYSLCPVKSYVKNIGHDGTGTHCGISSDFEGINLQEAVANPALPVSIQTDPAVLEAFRRVYRKKNILSRAINKIARIFLGKDLLR
jgi:hypothetical protein